MARKRAKSPNETGASAADPTERALFSAVLANPEDTPRLACADWLAEKGQTERAEFIRLQIERARRQRGDSVGVCPSVRENALLAAYGAQWLAPLPEYARKSVSFERGFPAHAKCEVVDFLNWDDRVWQVAPITSLQLFDTEAASGGYRPPEEMERNLQAVAAKPQLAHLRRLELREGGYTPPDLRTLLTSPYLTRLEHLTVAEIGWGQYSGQHMHQGKVMPVGGEIVNLLTGDARLPALTGVILESAGIDDEAVAALAESLWVEQLKDLNLCVNQIGYAGAEHLASSSRLGQLEILGLYHNQIGDRGAQALAASPYLGGLKELSLMANNIGANGQALLRERFGSRVVFGGPWWARSAAVPVEGSSIPAPVRPGKISPVLWAAAERAVRGRRLL
jgi:uncharacterized protein (TIGR02996 family)